MRVAVTVGCYRLPQFVELAIKRLRTLFGDDLPILLSDDLSDRSTDIHALSERYGCGYCRGPGRRSHFSGDLQAVVNALVFARAVESDIAIKMSQRFIPVLPAFREVLERAFADPSVQVGLPGRVPMKQIARPRARFYGKFGILTDVMALRTDAMTPAELIDVYRARAASAKHADSLVETTFGWLLANRFKDQFRIIPEWTVHQPFQPKIYLRKSQSSALEYGQVAAMEGLTGDWDLREWVQIEGKRYLAKPTQV